ncbi:MAG: lytic transglycosylase domain-containing protein [Vicinamibacterales bacterium]
MKSRAAALLVALALLTTSAGVRSAQDPPPSPPPEQVPFAEWLDAVRVEAQTRGISQSIIDQALDIDEPMPVVIERDRNQAEAVLPLETYINRRVTSSVVRAGRQMRERHRAVLNRVADAYGVPASIIVAIWGVESNFGRFTGTRPTVAALATLAWDPRRSAFFRQELFNALEILERRDIEFSRLRGSWAGAMGQPQFMPSSYLQYAVDFDEDGRRDIWQSHADIFASVANYLKGYGWVKGFRWGRDVVVPAEAAPAIDALARREGSCGAKRDMTVRRPLSEWRRLGLRDADGSLLPAADIEASLVSGSTRRFLVYDNYDAILSYNCAHAYALSVALLAERIG